MSFLSFRVALHAFRIQRYKKIFKKANAGCRFMQKRKVKKFSGKSGNGTGICCIFRDLNENMKKTAK